MAANRHTPNFRKCSHASVGLAQARPNYFKLAIQVQLYQCIVEFLPQIINFMTVVAVVGWRIRLH